MDLRLDEELEPAEFGALMRAWRETEELSLAGAANALSVSRRAVIDWSSGTKVPGQQRLIRLALLALSTYPELHEGANPVQRRRVPGEVRYKSRAREAA